jgi:starch synthase
MKAGLVFADKANTVSEGYAAEVRNGDVASYETLDGTVKQFQYSGGLEHVLSTYDVDLLGIRNGIDDAYDPGQIGVGPDWGLVDEDWRAHFAPAAGQPVAGWAYVAGERAAWRKKQELKRYLQERCNRLFKTEFEVNDDIPVVAIRSRLTEQKGFDLILRGLGGWRSEPPVQFVIVAWGEERYARELRRLAADHPDWLAFSTSWRDLPEPLHYAASDMFLMPSLFEPCGLPHMMVLRYGTIPIVRRTGGLADVVEAYDPATASGNGFLFGPPDVAAMLVAVERARDLYIRHPDRWRDLVDRAMQARDRFGQGFGWATAAERYVAELYGP